MRGGHKALRFIITLLALTAITTVASPKLLDVSVVTGGIYYRGELVEIYITVSLNGTLVDADELQVMIYIPYVPPIDPVPVKLATGVYRAVMRLGPTAQLGTYGVVVTARKNNYRGNGLTAFLVSPTLTAMEQKISSMNTKLSEMSEVLKQMNAKLAKIDEGMATLVTSLGEVKVRLQDIGARLIEVKGTVVKINTTVGESFVTLREIRAKVVNIEDGIATVQTDLGVIKGRVVEIHGDIAKIDSDLGFVMVNVPHEIKSLSTPAYSTLALALTAAVGSILTSIILWKGFKIGRPATPPPPPPT